MKRKYLLSTIVRVILFFFGWGLVAGRVSASDKAKPAEQAKAKEQAPAPPDISDCEAAKIRVAHLELIVADLQVQLKQAELSQKAAAANKLIEDVKATHKFGADVQFDPSTDRFFRTAPPPAKTEEPAGKK